jgi:hypothetical protein
MNIARITAKFVAGFLDRRAAGDSREKLGYQRENHARTSAMRWMSRAVE